MKQIFEKIYLILKEISLNQVHYKRADRVKDLKELEMLMGELEKRMTKFAKDSLSSSKIKSIKDKK